MNLEQIFDNYQQEQNFSKHQPQELYEPIDYILSLGGKRIRPLLSLLACQLYSNDVQDALPAAYAIELFHNFSLVHDDIMDASALRRGKASVHTKYNTNTAILSGDVMLVYAYQYLSKIPASLLPLILPIFNEVAIGVCEGQQLDVNFETQKEVSIPQYIEMITLKTSILLYGAMKIGALIGGATEAEAELVGKFGQNMGIAFQMQDDWLDSFGVQAKVGKRIGGDIVQNKKTYLVIKALELADNKTKTKLEQLLSSNVLASEEAAKIEEVTAIFHSLGIPAEMKKIMNLYYNKALANLDQLDLSKEKKQPLIDLLNMLMQREH